MSINFLRVALVGCGLISDSHIRAYQKHADRARITVCCDIDEAKAVRAARQVGEGARVVSDFNAVLADPDVDAVELCTPHHLHPDAVIAAARAGKHILCQKPLAKTLADCDAMIEAADKAGVVLYYGETNRTLPSVVAMKRAIEDGRIGRLIGLQATYAHWQGGDYLSTAWRYDPAITGGGQLLDGGIHYVDVLLHLGGPAESVTAFTTRFRSELGGEDTAVVNIRFAQDGRLGTLFASQASGIWFPDCTVAAFGLEGVLTLGGPHGALALHRPDLTDRREVLLADGGDGFATMTARYLDTILDNAPNPSPATIGRDDLRLVLAAYESARTGREVRLNVA